MKDQDLGFCKVQASPKGNIVALKLDDRALDSFHQIVERSKPLPTDKAENFNYKKDTVLGALIAARSVLIANKI